MNFRPGCIWTKRKTDSSRSCGRRCPTQTDSMTSAANCVSRTLYISAEPKRMPDGLRTPSDRPENMTCLVVGWIMMKSPCVQTSVTTISEQVTKAKLQTYC